MPNAAGSPITTSHDLAFSVFRMNPRRCGIHVYVTGTPRSRPIRSAISFSKPCFLSLLNGRLLGSAHTRNVSGSGGSSSLDFELEQAVRAKSVSEAVLTFMRYEWVHFACLQRH